MDDFPRTEVEHIGHLGLIAAIFDNFCITEKIDALLPKISNNQKINHAEAIKSMIYLGLGFSKKRLYSASTFFNNTPTEELIGLGVSPENINYDVLGRALDAIHSYGSQRFFTDISLTTLLENNLMSKFIRMDSTTHSFFGRKYEKNKDLTVCFGHSKGRQDLPQLVQLLMTTENGLPFWSETFTGSESDREIFQSSIASVQKYFKDLKSGINATIIADSALYSKRFLLNKQISGHWITRVPESIQKARKLVEADDTGTWFEMDDGIKFKEEFVKYGGKSQRWIVVAHRPSKYKEIATLEKKLKKEEENIEKKVKKLNSRTFKTMEAVRLEFARLKRQHPLFKFRNSPIGVYKRKRGKKNPVQVGIKCFVTFDDNKTKQKKLRNKKGRFIVATNNFDPMLTAPEIINLYRGQTSQMESCFKFLKDSTFRLNKVFLKKIERIDALMSVMALSLFINNLGQMVLREELLMKEETVPNQLGNPTDSPTLKWAFQLMERVVKVRVKIGNKVLDYFHGIEMAQKTIISCFGEKALKIYGFP